MEAHIIIDRSQALWGVQKFIEKFFAEEQGKNVSASLIHTILNSIKNSPAYAIQGLDVIYLQKAIPAEFLPMILNHEELHLLTFDILLEDGVPARKAMKLSNSCVDNAKLNVWLCEAFDVNIDRLMKYLTSYILTNLPIIGLIVRMLRRMRNAISKGASQRGS